MPLLLLFLLSKFLFYLDKYIVMYVKALKFYNQDIVLSKGLNFNIMYL